MGIIGDHIIFVRGVSYNKQDAKTTQLYKYIPLIRANNICKGKFILDDLVYIPINYIDTNQKINKNDIIITMSSGSKFHVGKVAIATKDYDATFGVFCGKLIPKTIYPSYLAYLLQSPLFRTYIENICKGTNINNIKQIYITNFEFDFPPFSQQELIVSRIEELFSELDKAVETLNIIKDQIKSYKFAILKEIFSIKKQINIEQHSIGEIPLKCWKNILHIINGKSQKEVILPTGKYPIYGSGGKIGSATDYLCEAGATIIGRKGTINDPIFVNERFWNIDTAFAISPGKDLLPRYLFYFCMYFNFKSL